MIEFQCTIHGKYSAEYNLIYVPILKNAHTWGEKFFSHNLSCNENVYISKDNAKLYKDKKFAVILRDPVDRWISALAQYLVEFDNNVELLDDPLIKKLITDGLVFDRHAVPQRYDLIGLDENRTVFFMCDDNLEKNVNLLSLAFFKKPTESVGELNRYTDNLNKQLLYTKIKNMVFQDPVLLEKIKQYYVMDYTIIAQAKNRIVNGTMDKYIFKKML